MTIDTSNKRFNATMLCNRAASASALGQQVDAVGFCNHAIKLYPKSERALQRRAKLLGLLGNYDAAVDDYTKLLQYHPSSKAHYKNTI